MPTSWDETVVPDASVNEYAIIARRKGNDWYVGAINNSTGRTVQFQTDFLGDVEYSAEIYKDADDAWTSPDHIEKVCMKVNKDSIISIDLASCGGFAMHIRPE